MEHGLGIHLTKLRRGIRRVCALIVGSTALSAIASIMSPLEKSSAELSCAAAPDRQRASAQ